MIDEPKLSYFDRLGELQWGVYHSQVAFEAGAAVTKAGYDAGFKDGIEAAAKIVEERGRYVGGAVDPTITAKAIRAMTNCQAPKPLLTQEDT